MPLTEQAIKAFQKETLSKSVAEIAAMEHYMALTKTTDLIGISLRGHILLENAIDDCINAYLVKTSRSVPKTRAVFFAES